MKSGVRIVYNKLLQGWYIVRGPHQTPIGGRFDSKQAARDHLEQRRLEQARSYALAVIEGMKTHKRKA